MAYRLSPCEGRDLHDKHLYEQLQGAGGKRYTTPAECIRALNVDPPSQRIFDGLRKYETAARGTPDEMILLQKTHTNTQGFNILSLEYGADAAFVLHRPADSPVPQVFRLHFTSTSLYAITA